VKQPIRQPKQSKKSAKAAAKAAKNRRAPPREQKSSFESFIRLDKSAVITTILIYCVIHWAIRTFIAPVYTIEEAEQLLLSQSLQVGYEARQPPMLAWLHALALMAGGAAPPVVFAVKYTLLFTALTLYYLAARNVLIRPGVSAAAVAAWALTFQVGWSMHEDLLGAVGLMAALSIAFHAITRILTWRRYRDWVYLGLAIGAGLLTHHLFIVFLVAIIIAIFLSPFFRDAMSWGRLGIALLVAALIYLPYTIWVVTHAGSIGDAWSEYAASWEIDSAWLERVGNASAQLGRGLLEFSLPLSLFWMMLFWTLWLPVIYPLFQRRNTDEEPHERAWRQLFMRATLFALLAYLISVVLGVQGYKTHWMMPVLFTAPVWLFMHVKRAGEFHVAIRAFGAVVIAFALLVIGGRFVEAQMEIAMCEEGGCRPYTPVEAWALELRKAGFSEGTIVGADRHLTGNLRAAFPRARVLDASIPPTAFPEPKVAGACLVVWRDTEFKPLDEQRSVAIMPRDLVAYLTDKLYAFPHDEGAEGAIRRNLRQSDDKAATLYYQFVRPSELCR
jgi:Ca2+/Na+ antiporter